MEPLHSPKQFEIVEISAHEACQFNQKWHSLLPACNWRNIVRNKDYKCYGAFFQGECYAVGIWSSPPNRNSCDGETLELRRMAIKEGAPRYTATWMLAKMIRGIARALPHIHRLISYQDTQVHTGTIYKAGNWVPVKRTYGVSWWTSRDGRAPIQTRAPKIRWEYYL